MLSITFLTLSVLLISANSQDCSQPPPKGVIPPDCCPGVCLTNHAAVEECGLPAPQSGGPGGPGEPKRPSCEAVQCFLKKDGLLTADNKINKAAFKTFSEQKYAPEWKPAITKAIATCDADTNKTDDCEARRYVFCFTDNMFLNCPSNILVQSTECSALKTFIEKCPKPSPPQ